MQEDAAVNDKNNANSCTNNFPALEIQICDLPHAKSYTTLHSSVTGMAGDKQANRWKSG
jgi:hypothetical protein